MVSKITLETVILVCGLLGTIKSAVLRSPCKNGNIDEQGPYFEGDIILSEGQSLTLKSGIIGSQYRWPGGKIPYTIDAGFDSSQVATIQTAMSRIQNKTCIRFYRRTTETSYVYIRKGAAGTGCSSNVGKQPGVGGINLEPVCLSVTGTVIHELVHSIGFYHEQSRYDRDDYVAINYPNINTKNHFNFNKYSASQVTTYNITYDYDSLMHYSAYAFAIDRNVPTISPKVSSVALSRLGQRKDLSYYDAQKIAAMYKGQC